MTIISTRNIRSSRRMAWPKALNEYLLLCVFLAAWLRAESTANVACGAMGAFASSQGTVGTGLVGVPELAAVAVPAGRRNGGSRGWWVDNPNLIRQGAGEGGQWALGKGAYRQWCVAVLLEGATACHAKKMGFMQWGPWGGKGKISRPMEGVRRKTARTQRQWSRVDSRCCSRGIRSQGRSTPKHRLPAAAEAACLWPGAGGVVPHQGEVFLAVGSVSKCCCGSE